MFAYDLLFNRGLVGPSAWPMWSSSVTWKYGIIIVLTAASSKTQFWESNNNFYISLTLDTRKPLRLCVQQLVSKPASELLALLTQCTSTTTLQSTKRNCHKVPLARSQPRIVHAGIELAVLQ